MALYHPPCGVNNLLPAVSVTQSVRHYRLVGLHADTVRKVLCTTPVVLDYTVYLLRVFGEGGFRFSLSLPLVLGGESDVW